jgi:hypothetical protein
MFAWFPFSDALSALFWKRYQHFYYNTSVYPLSGISVFAYSGCEVGISISMEGGDMDQNRILELALEGLQKQKAGIDAEIEAIQAELRGKGSAVRQARLFPSAVTGKRKRTPAGRKAQAERMRLYWAEKRAKAAKIAAAPKTSPSASPKRKAKTAAEKKALSLKMKQIWKKRKAAAGKNG